MRLLYVDGTMVILEMTELKTALINLEWCLKKEKSM